VAPAREPPGQPPPPAPAIRSRRPIWSIIIFVLLISSVGIRAYRDMSRPEAWAYWKDQYFSPSTASALIAEVHLHGPDHGRPALAITGRIGAAAAIWFRDRLDEAHLVSGDIVLLSSPGGDLNQAMIMGEVIRSRGLTTAVGVVDASGHIRASYCASACVFVYAGGKIRDGVEGSALGVHRFVTSGSGGDPVGDTQRTAGIVLSYMTKMGVSSNIVAAMSETGDVRWLGARDASAMNLITNPAVRP
jgi:hypothetical protein